MTKPWKPRASSLGYYLKCLWRAANDRKIHEGELPKPPEQDDTTAADLGSCGHFTLQDGLRCQFPRAARLQDDPEVIEACADHFQGNLAATLAAFAVGDPRCFAPSHKQWLSAACKWGGNLDVTKERVRAMATVAAGKVPRAPDGKPWLAEAAFENEFTSGHVDFLSQDHSMLGDLKTTAKPPLGNWIKPEHLAQLTAYHLMTGCKRAWVLYVDSTHQSWVTLVWVDFTTDGMKFYADQIADFCRLLVSDRLFEVAYPSIGDHCIHAWCKHRVGCYDQIMPPRGSFVNVTLAHRPTGPIRLTPLKA